MDNVTKILDEVKRWNDVPEIDFVEECRKNYPDDLFMMDGVEGKYAQEERYGVIVVMEEGLRKYG